MLPGIRMFLPLLFLGSTLFAQPEIQLNELASGYSFPVEMAHSGDSRLFIVEKSGRIRILMTDGQKIATPFLDIRTRVNSADGERGLLGLAFPPDHQNSGLFYVHYTDAQGRSVISRFSVSNSNVNVADPGSEDILLTVSQPFPNHNAGCLRFGPDSMLYIAMGDGGSGGDPGNRAQNPQNLLGKMLRIDVSGPGGYSIPPDNPFVNDGTVLDEIWSIGWRNPWKFSFDAERGDMWIADVGQNAREEVSVEAAGTGGLNYGWRCREGMAAFNTNNCSSTYQDPIWDYVQGPSTGQSITGGFVYRGENFPDLTGHYLAGDYVTGNVWTLLPDSQGQVTATLQGKLLSNSQLTSFGEDADGELYILSKSGTIYQIESTTSSLDDELVEQPEIAYLESGEILIRWEESIGHSLLEVYDLTGRLMIYEELSGNEYSLPATLLEGVYLVNIRNGRLYSGKIVVR